MKYRIVENMIWFKVPDDWRIENHFNNERYFKHRYRYFINATASEMLSECNGRVCTAFKFTQNWLDPRGNYIWLDFETHEDLLKFIILVDND